MIGCQLVYLSKRMFQNVSPQKKTPQYFSRGNVLCMMEGDVQLRAYSINFFPFLPPFPTEGKKNNKQKKVTK